ncbi:hypothetical protein BH11VER1_BH11VER1_29910 [soil metagenome]
MRRPLHSALLLGLFVAAFTGAAHAADEVSPAEAANKRLRDTLRSTMVQLQTAQAETAALQVQKAETDQKLAELTSTYGALLKTMAADKQAASKTASELDAKIAKQSEDIALINQALEKWKVGYKQAAQVANATEAKRAGLAEKVILLDRQVADQRVRNSELYKLGTEVLKRYENFGLGTAILAREPFTGIAKVKFETLVQDYQDKLVDQKIKPESPNGAAENTVATTAGAASAAMPSEGTAATPANQTASSPPTAKPESKKAPATTKAKP